MAIIYTYPVKTTPANDDLILISDSADGNKTKQVKMSSLPGSQGSGITSLGTSTSQAIGANQTFAIGNDSPITIVTSPNANRHTFGWTGQLAIAKGGTALGSVGSRDQVLTVNAAANALEYKDKDIVYLVKNTSSNSIPKGSALYVTGVNNGVTTVGLASAAASTSPACGLAYEDIAGNSDGRMILSGTIKNINTNSITNAANGAIVYLSTNPVSQFGLSISKPQGSSASVQVLGSIKKMGTTDGVISVYLSYYSGYSSTDYALPNLSQGNIFIGDANNQSSTLALGANGTVLSSNGTTATWATPSTGVTTFSTGSTGLLANGGTGNVSGAVTLSGILSVTNGGTGFNAYPVGSILIASATTSLAALTIGTVGKVLTVGSSGIPEWADNAVQANGDAGRIQVSGGSGVFSSNANLTFSTATTSLNVGDISNNRGLLVIHGDTSGNAGSIILKASAQSQGGGLPTTFGGYTVKSPATFPQGAVTNATWNLPQQTPSTAGSILTSGTVTGDTTNLTWASKTPVANGGTNQSTIGAYAVVVGTGATATELSSASTSAIQMPVGTTAERPTGALGMIRYNTDTGKMEAFVAGTPNAWTALH